MFSQNLLAILLLVYARTAYLRAHVLHVRKLQIKIHFFGSQKANLIDILSLKNVRPPRRP